MLKIAIVETHPVQYHAPVYQCLAQQPGLKVTTVYGSDFSVVGYRDAEFGASFAWDTDLLAGMDNRFLSRSATGGARNYEGVAAAGLSAALHAIAPDAVMALGYSHPFDRAALRWAHRQQVPLLFRAETSDNARQRHPLKSWLRDQVLRNLYRRCVALLYVGSLSRAHYHRLGVPDKRLFFSPYCVETSTFRCTAEDRTALRGPTRQQLGIAEDALVILFSGKLSERKGVDLIPKAVRLMPASLQQGVHLLFVGDGALKESLKAQCESKPRIKACFPGFQNQSALSAFYHAADVLVLPSREKETWGLVVNEAMLHGLPCVVSENVGSHPDLVIPGKTGEACQSGSASSLAIGLAKVMTALSEGHGFSADCHARVGRYSVPAAVDGIVEACRSLHQTSATGHR